MRRSAKPASAGAGPSPEKQLDAFLDTYAPPVAASAREVLRELRRMIPGAVELVYDKRNSLVIGFGPTERSSDAVISVVVYPRWVRLCFLQGRWLEDPEARLVGSGNRVRTINLGAAEAKEIKAPAAKSPKRGDRIERLDDPAIRALVAAAVERAHPRFDAAAKRRTIVRMVAH